jgi:hypothetical protein
MMTDENTPDSKRITPENLPEQEDKKGQMLVIYLPEGSVIVDRSDITLSPAQHPAAAQMAPEAQQVPPMVEQRVIEPAVEEPAVAQLQPTLQEVVQLAVAEALRITQAAPSHIGNKYESSAIKSTTENVVSPAAVVAPAAPEVKPEIKTAPRNVATSQKIARRAHVRRRRKINWVHGINTFLVGYILLVAILPAILLSLFGMAVYASNSSHPEVLISQGDLMVSHKLLSSQLKVNDVLLVRDGNSWRLDARQVTSNNLSGGVSTITTASTGGTVSENTYVLAQNAVSYKVTRVIPKLGYIPIVLSSIIVKIVGGLCLLILNLTVHQRRFRRRRLETVIR